MTDLFTMDFLIAGGDGLQRRFKVGLRPWLVWRKHANWVFPKEVENLLSVQRKCGVKHQRGPVSDP